MFDRLELLELFDCEKVTDKDIGATDNSLIAQIVLLLLFRFGPFITRFF